MNYIETAYNMGKEAAWTEMFGRLGERFRGMNEGIQNFAHRAVTPAKETGETLGRMYTNAAVPRDAIQAATKDLRRVGKNSLVAPAATGAAIGGVGGAIAGGENHRWSGALGGAALGAGVGIGTRVPGLSLTHGVVKDLNKYKNVI